MPIFLQKNEVSAELNNCCDQEFVIVKIDFSEYTK